MVEKYFKYDSAGKQFSGIGSQRCVVSLSACSTSIAAQLLANDGCRFAGTDPLQEAEGLTTSLCARQSSIETASFCTPGSLCLHARLVSDLMQHGSCDSCAAERGRARDHSNGTHCTKTVPPKSAISTIAPASFDDYKVSLLETFTGDALDNQTSSANVHLVAARVSRRQRAATRLPFGVLVCSSTEARVCVARTCPAIAHSSTAFPARFDEHRGQGQGPRGQEGLSSM
jgi:hypothetical protein